MKAMLIAPMLARLREPRDLQDTLSLALRDVLALHGAERGNIQMLDTSGRLVIVAQSGFPRLFLATFRHVELDGASVWAPPRGEQRMLVVDDVECDEAFEPYRPVARAVPYRSVVSSPMASRDGRLMGMVSAHFANVFTPSRLELEALRAYCAELADVLLSRAGTDPQAAAEALAAQVMGSVR